jgi:hypothetical protein
MAEAFARHTGKDGPTSDMLAMALFAMGNGIALEKMLEPDAVPDDLYPRMLEIFFTGLQAGSPSAQEPVASR